jgi:hypothetical protein
MFVKYDVLTEYLTLFWFTIVNDINYFSMDNLHVRLNFNLSNEKGIKHNS